VGGLWHAFIQAGACDDADDGVIVVMRSRIYGQTTLMAYSTHRVYVPVQQLPLRRGPLQSGWQVPPQPLVGTCCMPFSLMHTLSLAYKICRKRFVGTAWLM
jgi:hypothetical protein